MNHRQSFSEEKRGVLKRIGYADASTISTRIASLVDDYIDNHHDLIDPSFKYVYHDVGHVSGSPVRVGPVTLESAVLARLLARCERVAVFALTIGAYLEEMVAYLSGKGLVLQATVLDAVGSGAAETLAAEIEAVIGRGAEQRGRVISRRFSPGYCDWDVAQQQELFRLLGGAVEGIILTDSKLMVPRKSVSGVIGIGRPGSGIAEYNPCTTCLKKDCPGRRR